MLSPCGDGSNGFAGQTGRNGVRAIITAPPDDDFTFTGEGEAVNTTCGDGGDDFAGQTGWNVGLAFSRVTPGVDLSAGGNDGDEEEEDDRERP